MQRIRRRAKNEWTTLGTSEGGRSPLIRPRLEAEVNIDGQTVPALIDTGSPVTIVLLPFLLQVWRV